MYLTSTDAVSGMLLQCYNVTMLQPSLNVSRMATWGRRPVQADKGHAVDQDRQDRGHACDQCRCCEWYAVMVLQCYNLAWMSLFIRKKHRPWAQTLWGVCTLSALSLEAILETFKLGHNITVCHSRRLYWSNTCPTHVIWADYFVRPVPWDIQTR